MPLNLKGVFTMKKFFVIVLSFLMLSGSAFAVTPGYNPETGEIILPSEAALYENNSSTQNDLAEIQAAGSRRRNCQHSALGKIGQRNETAPL